MYVGTLRNLSGGLLENKFSRKLTVSKRWKRGLNHEQRVKTKPFKNQKAALKTFSKILKLVYPNLQLEQTQQNAIDEYRMELALEHTSLVPVLYHFWTVIQILSFDV